MIKEENKQLDPRYYCSAHLGTVKRAILEMLCNP